jgi:hypothetical protein
MDAGSYYPSGHYSISSRRYPKGPETRSEEDFYQGYIPCCCSCCSKPVEVPKTGCIKTQPKDHPPMMSQTEVPDWHRAQKARVAGDLHKARRKRPTSKRVSILPPCIHRQEGSNCPESAVSPFFSPPATRDGPALSQIREEMSSGDERSPKNLDKGLQASQQDPTPADAVSRSVNSPLAFYGAGETATQDPNEHISPEAHDLSNDTPSLFMVREPSPRSHGLNDPDVHSAGITEPESVTGHGLANDFMTAVPAGATEMHEIQRDKLVTTGLSGPYSHPHELMDDELTVATIQKDLPHALNYDPFVHQTLWEKPKNHGLQDHLEGRDKNEWETDTGMEYISIVDNANKHLKVKPREETPNTSTSEKAPSANLLKVPPRISRQKIATYKKGRVNSEKHGDKPTEIDQHDVRATRDVRPDTMPGTFHNIEQDSITVVDQSELTSHQLSRDEMAGYSPQRTSPHSLEFDPAVPLAKPTPPHDLGSHKVNQDSKADKGGADIATKNPDVASNSQTPSANLYRDITLAELDENKDKMSKPSGKSGETIQIRSRSPPSTKPETSSGRADSRGIKSAGDPVNRSLPEAMTMPHSDAKESQRGTGILGAIFGVARARSAETQGPRAAKNESKDASQTQFDGPTDGDVQQHPHRQSSVRDEIMKIELVDQGDAN